MSFLLIVALLFAPSVVCAQALTVQAPFDATHYTPLNTHDRWMRWALEDGGSAAIHVQSIASATYLQAIGDPEAWPRSSSGYARRLGSSYGGNLIQNSLHDGLAGLSGTDPRYFPCACNGFARRSGHALKWTFVTYSHQGKTVLDVPQIVGVYGSSMIQATWWPANYTARVQGLQTGHIQIGLLGAVHLVQEFAPEIKHTLHLHFGEHPPALNQ